MIFATSDLHGYTLESFKDLLSKVHFSDDDYLFVLGDVIDRNGDGGIKMLQWMMLQTNVELILGNHEAMLLACDFLFDEVTLTSIDGLTADRMGTLSTWLSNGALPMLDALRALREKDAEAIEGILDYLRDAPCMTRFRLVNVISCWFIRAWRAFLPTDRCPITLRMNCSGAVPSRNKGTLTMY